MMNQLSSQCVYPLVFVVSDEFKDCLTSNMNECDSYFQSPERLILRMVNFGPLITKDFCPLQLFRASAL